MKFSEETGQSGYIIRTYGAGTVELAGPGTGSNGREVVTVTTGVVVMHNRLIHDWGPAAFDQLARHHFEVLAELAPELVLLGCGERIAFPAPDLLEPLRHRGIGCEAMDTGAACRTYNILMGEGRRVAAALLMIRPPRNPAG